MSEQTILVTIGPTGEVTVTVEGVAGPGCQALTRPVKRALGVTRDAQRGRLGCAHRGVSSTGWAGLRPPQEPDVGLRGRIAV